MGVIRAGADLGGQGRQETRERLEVPLYFIGAGPDGDDTGFGGDTGYFGVHAADVPTNYHATHWCD